MTATALPHALVHALRRAPLAAIACGLMAIVGLLEWMVPLPASLAPLIRQVAPTGVLAWTGLVCAALSLVNPPARFAGLAATALLRWLPALVLTVIALLGVMAFTLGRRSGDFWLAAFDIPPVPAVVFLLLALRMLRERPPTTVQALREDLRISLMSLTVLTAVVVVTGIATFWAVQTRLQESEQERLVQSAYRREMAFNYQLANASRLAADLAQPPAIARAMARWESDRAGARSTLEEELAAAWREELATVRFELAEPGARLPARGQLLRSVVPGVVLEQATEMHFELQWNDGLMAYAKVPVVFEGRTVGWVVSQQRLPLMTEQLFETADLGQHVQVRLCAPAEGEALCMPSRAGGPPVSLPLHDTRGASSAIALAMRGEQGVTVGNDAAGVAVIDVYASVQRPLGLQLRQSIDTVVAPVREKLRQVFIVIGLMLAAGLAILNLQVRPLARRLVLNERRLSTVMTAVSDGIVTTDAQGRVTYLNRAAELMTGWQSDDALGRPSSEVYEVVDAASGRPGADPVGLALSQSDRDTAELDLVRRTDGARLPVHGSVSLVRDRSEAMVGAVLVFHDASAARSRSAAIRHEAAHDALTGLINRKEFERRLASLANEPSGNEARQHSLLYIDLDRFKQVNDTAGHAAGDELLRQVTRLMQRSLRASDMLARVGGDEFTVILPGCGLLDAQRIATHLRNAVAEFRFDWQGQVFQVGTSIGLASFESGFGDLAAIVATADAACYRAKQAGRNNVQVHEEMLAA